MRWQARIKATAVFTVDGSRARIQKDPKLPAEFVISRASARNDGVIISGRLHEPEGADNYIAELAAQIDSAIASDEGSRIIIVFDATSPSLAMRKFARVCDRWKQGYYVGEWLDTLLRALNPESVRVCGDALANVARRSPPERVG